MKYQSIFYGSGFFMLPMKLWELWQPVILIYAITVFLVVRRLFARTADAMTAWYLYIPLFGLGMFSYYQGRSHIYCLMPVIYPAVLLACFLGSDACERYRLMPFGAAWRDGPARGGLLAASMFWLLPALGIVIFFRWLPESVGDGWEMAQRRPMSACWLPMSPVSEEIEAELAALKPRLDGQEVLVLSRIGNYVHLKTGTYSPMPFSDGLEVVLAASLRKFRMQSTMARLRILSSATIKTLRCGNT